MKHTATKKKKKKLKFKETEMEKEKRSCATKTPVVNVSSPDTTRQQDQRREVEFNEEKKKPLNSVVVTFGSISLEEITSAYNKAKGDLGKPAEILPNLIDNDNKSEDPEPSTKSIWTGSSSAGFTETGSVKNLNSRRGRCKGGKQRQRVVAATGTVSTVLGKEYVRASARLDAAAEVAAGSALVKEEAEKILCSMLGHEYELSTAVVRGVVSVNITWRRLHGLACEDPLLGLCNPIWKSYAGYLFSVSEALDALPDLSAYSYEQCNNCIDNVNYKQDKVFLSECADDLTDRASDCVSNSSKSELQDSIWSMGCGCSSEALLPSCPGSNVSNLPRELLDSLFSFPMSSEQEPSSVNLRNVIKKMQSLGPGIDVCSSSVAEPQQDINANGDGYHEFRKTTKEQWDSVRSYFRKAATAYSKREWEYAAYLSDQGKIQTKLAREADERASQDIFNARNKGFENVITIDLLGQHVKQAIRLLKLHLLFGTLVPSIRTLRVITGRGTHGMGKSKLKQSVIKLVEKECIQWCEENHGALLVKLDGYREFSFLDSDSDTE